MRFSQALRAHNLKVLESNFDPRPSQNQPSSLDGEDFRYLLSQIATKVLRLHGSKTVKEAASIIPETIKVVVAEKHLSRISDGGLTRAILECVAFAT